jgi:hypothetical protein
LEIIAGNPDPEYGPCLLNVDKIGAGTHEVTPIIEEGRATVVILDPSGDVIFKRTLDEPHATIQPDEQGSVRLAQGTTPLSASSRTPPTPPRCWSSPRGSTTKRAVLVEPLLGSVSIQPITTLPDPVWVMCPSA